jgi:LysM repeat protein
VPENLTAVENPKTTNALAIAKLETEATCVTSGVEVSDKVQLFAGGAEQEEEEEDNGRAAALIKGMQDFFSTHENCDERFVFGYYNDTVAGVYIGDSLGKGTIQSSLKSLADNYASGSFPAYAAAQVCYSNGTDPGHVFGVTIESSRDLASVQETAVQWSKGHCFHKDGVSSVGDLPGAKVLQIAMGENSTLPSNATHSHAARHFSHKSAFGLHSSHGRHTTQLDKRATCSYITVAAGDTCPSLVKRCGIANTDFVKYNPRSGLCAAGTLKQGDFVCCSAGDLPSATPVAPKPGSDGVCATHLIQNGDTCTTLSARYGVTVDNLEKWNKKKTWAWTKCEDMLLGYNMCVSDGFAPMPPPAQGVSTQSKVAWIQTCIKLWYEVLTTAHANAFAGRMRTSGAWYTSTDRS